MKNFNFVKNKNIFFIITAVVIVLGVVCMIVRGFNVDTDFAGGTNMQVRIGKTLDSAELDNIRKITEDIIGTSVSSVQKSGSNSDEVIIKMKEIDSETRAQLFDKLVETYSLTDADLLSVQNVGASMSADLRRAAFISTAIAVVLMLIYIAFRFKVVSAVAAVICLVHDLAIMLIAYSLFQIPMQSTMIAALLTILGYSINATIIIFDRIREGLKQDQKKPLEDTVDVSIHSTLTRSINTTITTLLTIGMIYILGVESIRSFALPLIVGIVAGLYSSVCLAGNLWVVLDKLFSKIRPKKKS
ncbi:MAG: protein translocase subunit SecF [Clostridiales bacterium]|nr:protein translocase subunit SecF [Clostridiales bacterium]